MINEKLEALRNQLRGFEHNEFNGKFRSDFRGMAERQLIEQLGYRQTSGTKRTPPNLIKIFGIESLDDTDKVKALDDFCSEELIFIGQDLGTPFEDGIKENEYSKIRVDGSMEYTLATLGTLNLNVVSSEGVESPKVIAVCLYENWQPQQIAGCQPTLFPFDHGYVILHDTGIIQVGMFPNFVNLGSYKFHEKLSDFQFPTDDFALKLWSEQDYPSQEEVYDKLKNKSTHALQKLEKGMQKLDSSARIPCAIEEETLHNLTGVIADAMYVHKNVK